ncbi:hypothetical protein Lfu02_02620 [Longispora fulva]|uniref:DNA-binding SARP family transcriptional activator/DNA-binding CsgD family transcriptional regulator n=1 Tax=Longispora fulva TaxID=619741 RepID=A0A8J7GDW3_9ACTN|nr:BTAD domain-containing putative transcriptional regulator [Longispora fulva]MBG6135866.1 DNA-binding SARP family transcriptional activator/DNA-binding CsgD family transcriptional regulator [Longispora fulva]GIG55890.1 hypothetical protein Lfu02_02620 [Longispora fulva]
MQFRLLGPLETHTDHGVRIEPRAAKLAALLTALLLNANAWVKVDDLIEAIWHEQAMPPSAVRNLRSYVWQLRKQLGDRLEGGSGGYRLRVASAELDLDVAADLAGAARTALLAGEYEQAAGHAAAALGLWRGAPLDGYDFPDARATAARLDELHRELHELLAQAQLGAGRAAEAVAVLRGLTEREPLRESTWARLIEALGRAGRMAEGVAAFERVRGILAAELGVEPGPEVTAARHGLGTGPGRESGAARPVGAVPVPADRAADGRPRLSLVVGGRPAAGWTGIDALLAGAGHEVLVMSSGRGDGPIGGFRRVDFDNIRRGVRYRVLFPDSARLSGVLARLTRLGAEVRTDQAAPMEAIVIDRTVAVLPGESRAGVAVFRLPGVVTPAVELFERIWQAGVPLSPAEPPETGTVLTRRERDLLSLLCAGSTDESAAARLGISVRTVRRLVSDLMNRLGARSRFQAGAKAMDQGWLLDRAG